MSMIIAHNLRAINTKRNFATSSRGMSAAMEKLSSGYKINTGKDDPSGLIISEQLRAQLNGLKRAQQNTEEAINVMGIAEGALNEMNAILKKMKALAIHAANNGVTSPDQIAADQAEMDSAIQTLDRIAQTTKFSDQNLLNGSKDIAFDQDTLVKGTQQNSLVNTRESSFSQIFKRDGFAVSINFTGSTNADPASGIGDVDFSQQAMKAYVEVDTALGAKPQAQVDENGAFSQDQAFTLTGSEGSRSFKFNKGSTVISMVQQIKSAADSTGIDASLVFNSAQKIDRLTSGSQMFDAVQYVNVGLYGHDGQPLPIAIKGTADQVANLKDKYDITIQGNAGTFNSGTGVYSGYTVKINGVVISGAWNGTTALTLSGAAVAEFGSGVTLLPLGEIDPVLSFGAKLLTSGALPGLGSLSTGANSGAITFANPPGDTYDQFSDEVKRLLVGATNVELSVVTVGAGNTNVGPIKVRLSGTDADGNTFSFLDTFTFATGNASAGAVTSNGLAGGSIFKNGTKITVGQCDPTGFAAPSAPVTVNALKYQAPASNRNFYGSMTSANFDGVHNVAMPGATGGTSSGSDAARERGTIAVFNNDIDANGTGQVSRGITAVTVEPGAEQNIVYGLNTDGQGRIYVKFLDDNSFELYKDASLSAESKVAAGINGQPIKQVNNSGLEGLILNMTGQNMATKEHVYLALAGIEGQSETLDPNGDVRYGVTYDGAVVGSHTGTVSGSAMFEADRTLITGVELGMNTSDEGRIYLKNVYDAEKGTFQVFAYKHKDMRDEDMVARSEVYNTTMPNLISGGTMDVGSFTVVLNEIRSKDNTAGTGLGIVLSVDGAIFADQKKSTVLTGGISFTNLGARVYAQDYGSQNFLKITQDKGAIFTQYTTPGDLNSKSIISAGSTGTTVQIDGQDATLSINGAQVRTNGLRLSMANQDIQADLTFNQGKVGSTTLAQVGYEVGSIFTKVGALNLGASDSIQSGDYAGLSGLLCNAGHVTSEKLDNFQAGMQLQLGEGEGDQNRTIVGVKNMTADNLGRVIKGGYWETGNCIWTERMFTMKDVMGGGLASLSVDPILAMSIIEKGIADVAETRATIGAMQANLLQTNSNNLSVTMENIQKTESGIRDADMADEMTEFTKEQVLQSAAMGMLGQANASAQSVLQLLQ